MAQAKFLEIRRCAGVDQESAPAGMVVPFRGSNVVVLETSGMEMDVFSKHKDIKLHEFDGKDVNRELVDLNNSLSKPDVDPLFREAHLPTALNLYKPRYFRVEGKAIVGSPGVKIKAVPKPVAGRKAPSVGATLEVLSLDTMVIKVSIRNVLARDKDGSIVNHARLPCDPKAELANMNAIWTPQANIRFELIPQPDVLIDHDDKETQEELRKAFGLKGDGKATFSPLSTVYAEQFRPILAKRRVKGAHISFFLVHNAFANGAIAMGSMNSEFGVALISGVHVPTTFAHEAGHYLGRKLVNGQWDGHEHLGAGDLRKLMRRDGSSWAVPFGMVKRVRAFSGKPA